MAYTFDSTESTTNKANAMETKAMLHLLCFDENAGEITDIAVDCFNDVTGMDHTYLRLYDVQSKGESAVTPGKMGRYLVTLFKNHASDFSEHFSEEILFIGGVSKSVLTDASLTEFGYLDMSPSARQGLRKGFINQCSKVSYTRDIPLSDDIIDAFLQRVKFVIAKESDIDYVKPLLHGSSIFIPDERTLQAIFNKIRNAQSALKNVPGIQGKTIESPKDVSSTGRILTRRKIELMIIHHVLNKNPVQGGPPFNFRPYLEMLPPELESDRIEDCKNELTLQLFDKSSCDAFWLLLDEIVTAIQNDGNADVDAIFDQLSDEAVGGCIHLTPLSTKYFIAIVKDGIEQ